MDATVTPPTYQPPPPDLVSTRAAVHANGRQLTRWLNISRIAGVLACGVFGVLIPVGVAWALRLQGTLVGPELLLLVGTAALMFLQAALLWWVIGWTREYLTRLREWALGQPVDGARLDTLRRTLAAWLAFGQWGYMALLVLITVAAPFLMRLDPDFDFTAGESAAFTLFWLFTALASYAPAAIINWLVLGSVRRWMDTVTNRALHRGAALATPAANAVSTWFIVLLVLVGLSALSILPMLAFVPFVPLAMNETLEGAGTLAVTLILGATVLLSLAWMVLLFLLLLWSRGFALAVATVADHYAPTPVNFGAVAPKILE
ncbi:hypothetical protein [Deinococcus maricopensis]|uniref:Uncharacterized protein n=1 Tax=Deinococcus maricopensis (strain DSM 21211 / LMG 22137 / NRRL B-23946 / LB-34) TaxID=709986 RepID=E8U6J0_DEIML|nr:hypothetical protein [Deinococcus maricopensis]ADV66679.1 hypothetical protein Deima_1026 [Deinococcus maricopensis DSM 21211]